MATVDLMGADPEQQVAFLQARIREHLDALRPIAPGSKEYGEAADAAIQAATELIAYEERLPVLLDQAPRRLTLLIVRWSAVGSGAVGLSLGIAGAAGWLSRWWLLPVLVTVVLAAALGRMRVHPPQGRHAGLRPGAVAVAAGALLLVVCAAARLPVWMVLLALAVMAGGGWYLREHSVGARYGGGGRFDPSGGRSGPNGPRAGHPGAVDSPGPSRRTGHSGHSGHPGHRNGSAPGRRAGRPGGRIDPPDSRGALYPDPDPDGDDGDNDRGDIDARDADSDGDGTSGDGDDYGDFGDHGGAYAGGSR